jgi:electron transfer flavoprotein alpha subunit
MGPNSFEKSLKTALAMGYDEAYLLSDRKLGGSDTFATGLSIATMLKHIGISKESGEQFIVLAGRQTSDGDTAHVPSQVAENLGVPQATFVHSVKADGKGGIIANRIIEGGSQTLRLPIPCVVSLAPTGIPPRKPSLAGAVRASKAEVKVLSADDVGVDVSKVGISGSPTIVANVENLTSDRPPVSMSEGSGGAGTLVDGFIERFEKGGNAPVAKVGKAQKEVERPDFPEVDPRGENKGILTWAEVTGDRVARPSLELLTPARHLAEQLGNDTKITTALIGKNVAGLADTLFEHGADEVILVEEDRLEEYLVLPFSDILSQIMRERKPEIAIFAATTAGRELAPRIGSKTGSGVTADCTGLEIGEYINRKEKTIIKPILHSRRPTYGESKLATILGFVYPQISTARAGTFELPERAEGCKGVVSKFEPVMRNEDFAVEIVETNRSEGGLQSLFEADIIVAGGRGAMSDNLALIKELTEALKSQGIKAEWGCSRVVVNEGVAEYARQIGQTGKTVRPKVYIAVGISGAIQHIAGIKESGKIVAVDYNMKASIFNHADFGIVGDYSDVLPELIERVKKGFTFGVEPAAK